MSGADRVEGSAERELARKTAVELTGGWITVARTGCLEFTLMKYIHTYIYFIRIYMYT